MPPTEQADQADEADATAAAVEVLRSRPERTAVLTDFDGTLSPIVVDPREARPLAGAIDALSALARRYGRVAVISGRPVAYLIERLGTVEGPIILSGLYGLEEARRPPHGEWEVRERRDAAHWRTVMVEVAVCTGSPGRRPCRIRGGLPV